MEAGLARSRTLAARLVREGRVRVDGTVVTKPSARVDGQHLEADREEWVCRAAHKLLGALDDLSVQVPPVVLDAGASTGGFSQVVLSRGAELVHAVDVGHDQLDPLLRSDPRVVVHEGLNVRNLTRADLSCGGREPDLVDLVVGDLSFISLTMVLAPLAGVTAPGGSMLLLVKPQFEVGRRALGPHGVVTDPGLRRRAVDGVVAAAAELGWGLRGECDSRLAGQDGNVEHFVLLTRVGDSGANPAGGSVGPATVET